MEVLFSLPAIDLTTTTTGGMIELLYVFFTSPDFTRDDVCYDIVTRVKKLPKPEKATVTKWFLLISIYKNFPKYAVFLAPALEDLKEYSNLIRTLTCKAFMFGRGRVGVALICPYSKNLRKYLTTEKNFGEENGSFTSLSALDPLSLLLLAAYRGLPNLINLVLSLSRALTESNINYVSKALFLFNNQDLIAEIKELQILVRTRPTKGSANPSVGSFEHRDLPSKRLFPKGIHFLFA